MPEIQIDARIELVDLAPGLISLYHSRYGRSARALRAVSYAGSGFESPAVVNARSVQGPREHRIEVDLESAYGAFEDRTNFNVARVGQELRTHERELGYQADIDGKMPGFRSIEMRQHAPSGILKSGAGNHSIELHETQEICLVMPPVSS